MNEKKLSANRMNARKSTGPRSANGKAKSSRNSLRHGLLAQSPIISGVESRKQWEGHRDAVLESFGPLDYPHKLLAIQLAVSLWNLWRADRIEAKMAETAVAVAESELEQRTDKPSDPATARVEAQRESMILGLLNELSSETNDEEGVDRHLAVATLWALWRELPSTIDVLHVPGIPDDDVQFNAFDHWTLGLLRQAAKVYAAAAGLTPDVLMTECISSVSRKRESAEAEESNLVDRGKRWELILAHGRMLLQADARDKWARYKSNLERSSFRILHELQRYQASRSGVVVTPPVAIDMDVTLDSNGSLVGLQKHMRTRKRSHCEDVPDSPSSQAPKIGSGTAIPNASNASETTNNDEGAQPGFGKDE